MGVPLIKATAIGSATSLVSFVLFRFALQQSQEAMSIATQAPALAIPTFLSAALLAVGAIAALWWALSATLIAASLLHGSTTRAGRTLRRVALGCAPKAFKGLLTTTASAGLVFSTLPAYATDQSPHILEQPAASVTALVKLSIESNEAQHLEQEFSLTFGATEIAGSSNTQPPPQVAARPEVDLAQSQVGPAGGLNRGSAIAAGLEQSRMSRKEHTPSSQSLSATESSSSSTNRSGSKTAISQTSPPGPASAVRSESGTSAGTDTSTGTDTGTGTGTSARASSKSPTHKPQHSTPSSVVVRNGDCLWEIAARGLPSGSTNAEIADHWHKIYELNRTSIGDDPDLLLPGTTLKLPA